MKDFLRKFQIEELLLTQLGNWNVSLRPLQTTLGALVISLNRPCLSLADLTDEESLQLNKVFKLVNEILQSSFSPDKINYLALMMVDAHVHFHVIPRYEEKISFLEKEYVDHDWPKPPNLLESIALSNQDIKNILEHLKYNFKELKIG